MRPADRRGRVGGITEAIVHDRNGLLFEAGNAEALAEQLFLLHGDAALRERLGRQARLDIEARRPVADVVQDWQRLYRHAAFAFGESLYPDPDLLDRVRSRCEGINVPGSSVDLYVAAMRGCGVVSELTAGGQLPAGVPLDLALVRAVAFELHRALRRNGYTVPFSANALTDVMSDLSLALLNSDRSGPDGFRLSAEETRARMAIPPSTRP